MEEAEASGKRYSEGKPLSVFDGVPIAIKDMITIKGLYTHYGTNLSAAVQAESDDPIVARFRAVGGIIVGATVMTEFGVSPLGFNAKHQGPANPFNTG